MRHLGLLCLALAALVLAIGMSALATPQRDTLTVTTSTTTSTNLVAATNTIRGYVEEVVFDVPAGTQTGTVSLVTLSNISTEASRTIAASNSITADLPMRPRWQSDNSTGTATGTEYQERFLLVGEQIVFSLTGANSTNVTWKCHVKFDDGK